MQRPAISQGTSLILPPELQRDRRKHVRYKAKEGALVSPVAKKRSYWKMLDISLGGMSFRYIPCEDLNGCTAIDIAMTDLSFALENIPFRVVSDIEFMDYSSSFIRLRRCGVEFVSSANLLESFFAEFIGKFTFS